jgi:hypothetical protein
MGTALRWMQGSQLISTGIGKRKINAESSARM